MTEIHCQEASLYIRRRTGRTSLDAKMEMYIRVYCMGTVCLSAEWILGQTAATLEEMAAKSGIEIEWGGGVSDDNSLASVFNAGATQAIIGSVAALRPAEFSRWLKIFGPERIILGADVRDGAVAVKGWMQQTGLTLDEQIGWFLEDGLKYIVCTDISRDGLLQGPSFELYAKLMDEFQGVVFTASGGISCMDDIKELDRIGVPKVIVGKAIYEKRITLDDIRKWSLNE